MADTNKDATSETSPTERNNKTESEKPSQTIIEEEDEEDENDQKTKDKLDMLNELFKLLQLNKQTLKKQKTVLGDDLTLEGVANAIKDGKIKNIVVLTGAGISVAAGIPDFRTPGTGLYDNLKKYNLPRPTAVFEIDFFQNNPKPFYELAREMYPGKFNPTPAHYFVRLLQQKGLLVCNYTQNIDTLERVAGIPDEYLVEAHGSFASAHCIGCKKEHSTDWIKEIIFGAEFKIPQCTVCQGYVKPDIIFFGEALPKRFFEKTQGDDFGKCDLLIVIGTSLQVQPFASLANYAPSTTPRLLINRELAGNFTDDPIINYRDVCVLEDIQDGIKRFVQLLGWEKELEELLSLSPEPNFLK